MTTTAERRSLRLVAALSAIAVIAALLPATGAEAAPAHKQYTASITTEGGEPSDTVAGMTTTYDVTFTNLSKHTKLGGVQVEVDSDFDVQSATAPQGWNTSVSGHTVQATSSHPHSSLQPGESVTVSIELVNPLDPQDDPYVFETDARQANKFKGTGNGLNYVGDPLKVAITGSADACTPNCEVNFSGPGATAKVSTDCSSGEPCGNLSLDLDPAYCEGACIGLGSFWNPPSTDTRVDLEMTIDVTDEKLRLRDLKHLDFWVVKDGETEPQKCERDWGWHGYGGGDEAWCEYQLVPSHKELKWNHHWGWHWRVFEIKVIADLDPDDPRGFVS